MRRFVQAFVDAHSLPAALPIEVSTALATADARFNIGKDGRAWVWAAGASDADATTVVAEMQWGLVPRWSKQPSTPYTTVTARLDRAPRSRLFADAWMKRRCVVPMTGYFKWDRQRRPPWPMFVQRRDGLALLAAALWEHWHDDDGQQRDTFSILTDGNPGIPSPLSADGPVFLEPAAAAAWLGGSLVTPVQLRRRAHTAPLEACYVGLGIRDRLRDDYTLLEPVDPDAVRAGDALPDWDDEALDEDA
ncbi:SOS response-associated peptidase family protein [Stenotrophomonas sp. NPDC077659]|uniref:SOS response-associated peptidase family protein n=1 Tax=Stenotrophomonas sp. NPDC077659 TaxID=3390694 RepID=UPI003D01534D